MLNFDAGTPLGSQHLADLFSTAPMRFVFGEKNSLQTMLDVEVALAQVQANLGIIPSAAAETIRLVAKADRLDLVELAAGPRRVGLPIVNLVEQLGRLAGPEHGAFVHWGTTSQDIMDTALVLQMREALTLIERGLDDLVDAVAGLARTHRDTPMVGRTKLQHASPITFGFKTAVWLSGLLRHRQRLAELAPRLFQVQFGCAVGNFASLGIEGPRIRSALASALGLNEPLIAWHTARDTLAETVGFLGLLSTTLSKMANDIALLAQTEVGELLEPGGAGHGASSTMPHKRNPILCEQILSSGAVIRRLAGAMLDASIHDHERATGPWQGEWLILPEAFLLISGALDTAVRLSNGLVVRPDRMQANLDQTQGLIAAEAMMMALAPRMGLHHAHVVMGAACARTAASGQRLADALVSDPEFSAHFTAEEIRVIVEPRLYVGLSAAETDRVLAACPPSSVRASSMGRFAFPNEDTTSACQPLAASSPSASRTS